MYARGIGGGGAVGTVVVAPGFVPGGGGEEASTPEEPQCVATGGKLVGFSSFPLRCFSSKWSVSLLRLGSLVLAPPLGVTFLVPSELREPEKLLQAGAGSEGTRRLTPVGIYSGEC